MIGLRRLLLALGLTLAIGQPTAALAQVHPAGTPIVIGQSYALPSAIMGTPREINVWLPTGYDGGAARYPVLYVLDGGQTQDFHHISGLAQLGTVVGTTRDVIVVGIASVDRRNELALPTDIPELVARYPTLGHSDQFRRFVAEEVMPFIDGHFRTSDESALMGESLAGLFVVETFLKAPDMFDAYIAVSPSLWWDRGALTHQSGMLVAGHPAGSRSLILTLGDEGAEMDGLMGELVASLGEHGQPDLDWTFQPRPAESHATIYHGAALDAFRSLYAIPAP